LPVQWPVGHPGDALAAAHNGEAVGQVKFEAGFVFWAGRPGSLARLDRALEGSVSAALIHRQQRPVLIVPEPGNQPVR
jgi:hypothetical protein